MNSYLDKALIMKNEAENSGDAGRFEALEMIIQKLSDVGRDLRKEEGVLLRLQEDLNARLKEYEDYVTSDHAKARSQYKADLDVIRRLLESHP